MENTDEVLLQFKRLRLPPCQVAKFIVWYRKLETLENLLRSMEGKYDTIMHCRRRYSKLRVVGLELQRGRNFENGLKLELLRKMATLKLGTYTADSNFDLEPRMLFV